MDGAAFRPSGLVVSDPFVELKLAGIGAILKNVENDMVVRRRRRWSFISFVRFRPPQPSLPFWRGSG